MNISTDILFSNYHTSDLAIIYRLIVSDTVQLFKCSILKIDQNKEHFFLQGSCSAESFNHLLLLLQQISHSLPVILWRLNHNNKHLYWWQNLIASQKVPFFTIWKIMDVARVYLCPSVVGTGSSNPWMDGWMDGRSQYPQVWIYSARQCSSYEQNDYLLNACRINPFICAPQSDYLMKNPW